MVNNLKIKSGIYTEVNGNQWKIRATIKYGEVTHLKIDPYPFKKINPKTDEQLFAFYKEMQLKLKFNGTDILTDVVLGGKLH
jgi:hypothetical protein